MQKRENPLSEHETIAIILTMAKTWMQEEKELSRNGQAKTWREIYSAKINSLFTFFDIEVDTFIEVVSDVLKADIHEERAKSLSSKVVELYPKTDNYAAMQWILNKVDKHTA